MVQTRHSPAGFAPLAAPLETPKLDGLAKYYEQLNQQDGIALPYKERNSPSKRRKSPGHDIVFQIQFLYFQDPDSLEKVVEEFRLRSPTLHNNDDKLNLLFETLSIAVNSIKKSGTPGSSRRQLEATPSPERSGLQQATSMGLSISAPKTKDTPTSMGPPDSVSKTKDTPTSSHWPPRLLQSTQVEKEEEVKPPDSPTLSIKTVRKMQLDKIAQHPQLPPPMEPLKVFAGITSANTSFTTNTSANTSFSSEAHSSQNSLASSQTSIDSLPCMDGANDLADIASNRSQIPMSSWNVSEFDARFDEAQKSLQLNKPQMSSIESGRTKTPPTSVGPDQQHVYLPAELLLENSTTKQTTGLPNASPPKERVEAAEDAPKESPGKQLGEHIRVRHIPTHGLMGSLVLSPALLLLPFELRYECARVMSACNLTAGELEARWQRPRNLDSLGKIAKAYAPTFHPSSDATYEACSYQLKLRYSRSKDNSKPLFEPEDLQLGQDHLNSLQRKFGCDRLLFVDTDSLDKVPKQLRLTGQKDHIRQRFLEMLKQPQRFLGRTWLQFHGQPKKSNRKSTNPNAARPGGMQFIFLALSSDDGSLPPLGLRDVVGWAIPFAHNLMSSWCKVYARLDLRISRAVLVVYLEPSDVEFPDDVFATEDPPDSRFNDPKFALQFAENEIYKPDTVMNDGCSLADPYIFWLIEQEFGCTFATALAQFRFAGAKGVIYRKQIGRSRPYNPGVRPAGPLIRIHPSQLKVFPGHNLQKQHYDKHYWALYIVRISNPAQPSVLYMDFLPILIDRGVPSEVIEEIALQSAKLETEDFLQAIYDPGKLRGWIHKENAALENQRRDHDIGTLAGFPKARLERAICMIESGFEATKFKPLAEDVENAAAVAFERKKKFFRIALPESTNVVGVADLTGTLEPGEVYFAPSTPFIDPITRLPCSCIEGDVLVARSPSARPSDIQRMRAVRRPELGDIFDVVVFSAKGPRPPADKLSGGDYDGDTYWLCWDRRLVEPFENAPAPQQLPDPTSLGIKVDKRKVGDIVADPDSEAQIRLFVQMATANRMQFNLLGVVTKTLGRVTHLEGLHTRRATALMDLKDLIMDSDKNGRTFDFDAWETFKEEYKLYNLPIPAHFKYTNPVEEDQVDEIQYKPKDSNNIIDKVFFDVLGRTFDSAIKEAKVILSRATMEDTDLAVLYEQLRQQSEADPFAEMELKNLKENLQNLQRSWGQHMGRYKTLKKQQEKVFAWDTAVLDCRRGYDAIVPLHDTAHVVVREWTRRSANELTVWDRLKASAMAKLLSDKKMWFQIAGSEICQIKAETYPQYRILPMFAYKLLGPRRAPKRKVDVLDDDAEREVDADAVEAAEEQDGGMGADM